MAKIKVLILIPLVIETENFVSLSPKEAGLSRLQCLFRANVPVKKKISTTVKNVGIRTFYELDLIPSVFDKIKLPAAIHGKGCTCTIPLIVTRPAYRPRRNLSRPYLIYTAFDPGFPQERLEKCSSRDMYGNMKPVNAWQYRNEAKFVELWPLALNGSMPGFTTWSKEKTILAEDIP